MNMRDGETIKYGDGPCYLQGEGSNVYLTADKNQDSLDKLAKAPHALITADNQEALDKAAKAVAKILEVPKNGIFSCPNTTQQEMEDYWSKETKRRERAIVEREEEALAEKEKKKLAEEEKTRKLRIAQGNFSHENIAAGELLKYCLLGGGTRGVLGHILKFV